MGATSVGCGPLLVAHNRFRVVLPPLFWRAARRTKPVDPGDPSPAVCSFAYANLSGTPVDVFVHCLIGYAMLQADIVGGVFLRIVSVFQPVFGASASAPHHWQ